MKHRKRIAVIGLKGLPAFGGAAAVGESIIDQLKDKYEFTVLSTSSHTTESKKNINGISQIIFRSHGTSWLSSFIYYLKCMFFVMFRRFDLIHLHHGSTGFITPVLRLKYNVVTTFHGVTKKKDPKFSNFQNSFIEFCEKLNVYYSSTVVSVSRPDRDFLKKKFQKEIKYIPNGIKIPKEKEKKENNYLSFAAGRIYQIKGLHFLLDSIQRLNENIPLIVAGDLNQVKQYKSKIIKQSKDLNVKFLGLIKDKEKLLDMVRHSKLFIFPSTTEAMSMMLLEVVSVKTPIIASDIPANRSIFSDEEVLFFKSEDPQDLLDKLKFALLNNEIMKKKALAAFKRLEKSYTWKFISIQYSNIYLKYLE